MMSTNHSFRLDFTPTKIFLYMPHNIQTRLLFMDGRKFPPDDELELYFKGTSIARWEGDVLVIESRGFNSKSYLTGTGVPHSESLRIVERVRMIRPDELRWEITLTDPGVLERPWSTTKRYLRVRSGQEEPEFVCSLARFNGVYPVGTPEKRGAVKFERAGDVPEGGE